MVRRTSFLRTIENFNGSRRITLATVATFAPFRHERRHLVNPPLRQRMVMSARSSLPVGLPIESGGRLQTHGKGPTLAALDRTRNIPGGFQKGLKCKGG